MDIHYKYDINKKEYSSKDFNILNYDIIVYLNCSFNNLINLPILPNSLKKICCSYNNLVNLPILPNCLELLYCQFNKLIHLPILSNCLITLTCLNNNLNYLPILPNYLKNLICIYNKLYNLSKMNKHIYIVFDDYYIKYINIYNLYTIKIRIYEYIEF